MFRKATAVLVAATAVLAVSGATASTASAASHRLIPPPINTH